MLKYRHPMDESWKNAIAEIDLEKLAREEKCHTGGVVGVMLLLQYIVFCLRWTKYNIVQ